MGVKLYFDTFLIYWFYTRFIHSDTENFFPKLNLLNHEPDLLSEPSVESCNTWSFASAFLTSLRIGVFKNGAAPCFS